MESIMSGLLLIILWALWNTLISNIPGLVVTLATFALLVSRGTRLRKSLTYCFFLLGGIAVANLQWMIITDGNTEAVRWLILGTEMLVGTLTLIAFLISLKFIKEEKILIVLFALTIGLGILQFSDVPHQLLNSYARLYALACLGAPLLVLVKTWNRPKPST